MSAKKVSKYIRQQRREQRRAQKLNERETKRAAKSSPEQARAQAQDPTQTQEPARAQAQAQGQAQPRPAVAGRHARAAHSGTPAPKPALERLTNDSTAARSGSGTRAAAVVVGASLIAVLIGSAAMEATRSEPRQPSTVAAHSIAAPAVTERLVCPPMPGQPDSLTDQGLLDYVDPDPSVSTMIRTVALPTGAESEPQGQWAQLTQDGRANAEPAEPGYAQENRSPSSLMEIQPPEDEPTDARSRRPTLATSFTYHADSGPVTGLASQACTAPQRHQWFLGPEISTDASTGAISLLTLANPHDRPATVEVTTFDRDGDRGAPGATTVLVPEQSVRSVNLAALTDASGTAVRVSASGAPVAATLQSALTSGSEGLGVELLPSQSASLTHLMPGVLSGPDDDAQLFLHIPGEEPATVELQVFDENGQVAIETPGVFSAEAGRVAVLSLNGLEPGTYDVSLRTDVPSLAAVRTPGDGAPVTVESAGGFDPITGEALPTETEEDPAEDFSWSGSAAQLSAGFGALLPDSAVPLGVAGEDGVTESDEPADVQSELRLFAPIEEESTGAVVVNLRLVDAFGTSTEPFTVELTPGQGLSLEHEDMLQRAQEAELEELAAVVVDHAEAPAYGTLITRTDQGRFTLSELRPLTRGAQHVPLHLSR